MKTRYFLIEPKYSDPDTFCSFIVGSDRVRASINIYADVDMLREVAWALSVPDLKAETSKLDKTEEWDFKLHMAVLPRDNGGRTLRVQIIQNWLNDGAPFSADVQLIFSRDAAAVFARDLSAWCERRDYTFNWAAD